MNISGYSRPITNNGREGLTPDGSVEKASHNPKPYRQAHPTTQAVASRAPLKIETEKSSGMTEIDSDDEPLSSKSKRRRKPNQSRILHDTTQPSTPQERPSHDSRKPQEDKRVGPVCIPCNRAHKKCDRSKPCSTCEIDGSSQCSSTSFMERYRANDLI